MQAIPARRAAGSGAEMIAKVITGVRFRNGVDVQQKDHQKIAA